MCAASADRKSSLVTVLTTQLNRLRRIPKAAAPALCAVFAALTVPASAAQALGDTRSLKIYYVNTGERAVITYKRDGMFDPRGLAQLNQILRDWRKNQPTKMNPRLFDLLWEVYRESGSNQFISVICGFRSPETNEMLRSRSAHTGVAKESQHMLGNAIDFFIPDVRLAKLREIGVKLEEGGVGFYPTSGSPFVHMDVGGVRAWPRLPRQELVSLFPDGTTMHIPADGRRLPGYDRAVAQYKRRMVHENMQIAIAMGKRDPQFIALNNRFGRSSSDERQVGTELASALVSPVPLNAAERALTVALDGNGQPKSSLTDLTIPLPSLLPERLSSQSTNNESVASIDADALKIDQSSPANPDFNGRFGNVALKPATVIAIDSSPALIPLNYQRPSHNMLVAGRIAAGSHHVQAPSFSSRSLHIQSSVVVGQGFSVQTAALNADSFSKRASPSNSSALE